MYILISKIYKKNILIFFNPKIKENYLLEKNMRKFINIMSNLPFNTKINNFLVYIIDELLCQIFNLTHTNSYPNI